MQRAFLHDGLHPAAARLKWTQRHLSARGAVIKSTDCHHPAPSGCSAPSCSCPWGRWRSAAGTCHQWCSNRWRRCTPTCRAGGTAQERMVWGVGSVRSPQQRHFSGTAHGRDHREQATTALCVHGWGPCCAASPALSLTHRLACASGGSFRAPLALTGGSAAAGLGGAAMLGVWDALQAYRGQQGCVCKMPDRFAWHASDCIPSCTPISHQPFAPGTPCQSGPGLTAAQLPKLLAGTGVGGVVLRRHTRLPQQLAEEMQAVSWGAQLRAEGRKVGCHVTTLGAA